MERHEEEQGLSKRLTVSADHGVVFGATNYIFLASCLDAGQIYTRRFNWTTDGDRLNELEKLSPLWLEISDSKAAGILQIGNSRVQLEISREGSLNGMLSHSPGDNPEEEVTSKLKELFPEADPHAGHRVEFTLWARKGNTYSEWRRMLGVPEWAEIRGNYPALTRSALDALMRRRGPLDGGMLVLWHGPAGTGKTHALRSLAWEWRDWCHFDIVVDPETFFSRPDYMLDVLLSSRTSLRARDDMFHILVLEDTGELLSLDAKEHVGQSLSRFLNLTDGVLGQGLHRLTLLTTNEPVSLIHPAVSRPGRCGSNIEFPLLRPSEAEAWLKKKHIETSPRSMSLAEVFSLARGGPTTGGERKMGFGE